MCIPRKNKIKKTPASSVLIKDPIVDTVNPKKILKQDSITDAENVRQHKTPWTFLKKEYYEDDTNKNNSFTDDSQTGNDDCVRNLDKKQENEEDEELQKDSFVVIITNELKWSESKKTSSTY